MFKVVCNFMLLELFPDNYREALNVVKQHVRFMSLKVFEDL